MTHKAPLSKQLEKRRLFWYEYWCRWMTSKLHEWDGDLDELPRRLNISPGDWREAMDYLQDEAAKQRKEAKS